MKNMKILLCPWCNEKYKLLGRHIRSKHNKTKEDYYIKINNLTEMPKCQYSKCNNKVTLYSNSLTIVNKTCCRNHAGLLEVENKTSPFIKDNRIKDENGLDIYSIKSNLSAVKNGTHKFIKKNRLKDPITGKDIISSKTFNSQIKNGTFNFLRINRYDELGRDKFLWSYINNSTYGSCKSTWSRNKYVNECAYIYIIVSKSINRLKIGVTRSPKNRINTFKYFGINIDEIYLMKYYEDSIAKFESELHYKYKDYLFIIKESDNKFYKRLGYSEWFNISIYDNLLEDFNNISNKIKSSILTTT